MFVFPNIYVRFATLLIFSHQIVRCIMFKTKISKLLAILAISVFMLSMTETAHAIGIGIKVSFTRGSHNEEGNCVGNRGICEWDVSVTISKRVAPSGDNQIEGEAEVKENFLMLKLKGSNQRKVANDKGKSVFPLHSDVKLDDETAKALGYSSIVLAAGNYELTGNNLKIKIKSSTPLKRIDKSSPMLHKKNDN